MTLTPAAFASCSMCAPVPESSGSTTRTLAPLVIADWARLTWVASCPSAFWTVRSAAGRPAAANACFSSGVSNSTYRVEDTVSGRMTATLPLPAAAMDVSCDMALNVLFRLPIEMDAAGALLDADVAGADVGGELEPLLLQAAMSSAALTPAPTPPAFLKEGTNIPRLLGI